MAPFVAGERLGQNECLVAEIVPLVPKGCGMGAALGKSEHLCNEEVRFDSVLW